MNVYPPKARQFVQLIFTTSAPGSFNDLPLFATDVAKALTVSLTAAEPTTTEQPHLITSANPVDRSFEHALGLSKALAVLGVLFVAAALGAVIARLAAITVTNPYSESGVSDTPAIPIFLATCSLIPAELLRRGAWSERQTTFLKGGSKEDYGRVLWLSV